MMHANTFLTILTILYSIIVACLNFLFCQLFLSFLSFLYIPLILCPKKDYLCVQIDSDKTVMVTFKHDDKLQENAECGFQVIMRWKVFSSLLLPWLFAYFI